MQVHLPLCFCASVHLSICASVRPCVRASVSQCMTLKGHTRPVNSVAWCKGDQLASASDDQSVVVWNVASGEQVSTLKGHTGPVNSIAWGQGNQIASASDDGTVVVWNVASGRGYRRSRTHMSCQQRLVGQVQLTPFSLR